MYLLYGFGLSLKSAAKYLKTIGEKFIVHDDSIDALTEAENFGYLTTLEYKVVDQSGIEICLNKKYTTENKDIIIKDIIVAPGVSPQIVNQFKKYNLNLHNDISLFFKLRAPTFTIGITGSFGKSTTTALITHIYNLTKGKMEFGGNIGRPIFDCNPEIPMTIELSSAQLEIAGNLPLNIALVLNVYPQHLDRYGSIESYRNTKFNIYTQSKIKIINFDLQKYYSKSQNYKTISLYDIRANYTLVDGSLYENGARISTINFPIADISLIGAYAIAREADISSEDILQSLASFKGLPHRMEILYQDNHRLIVNDSKSTNLLNSIYCLKQFANYGQIAWIAGGKLVEQDLSVLDEIDVSLICTTGESGRVLADYLTKLGKRVIYCATLDECVKECLGTPVILFSPGYRSVDQYKNFEQRGECFRQLIEANLHSTSDNYYSNAQQESE